MGLLFVPNKKFATDSFAMKEKNKLKYALEISVTSGGSVNANCSLNENWKLCFRD